MPSQHLTVLYDACVLYPAPLRDLLIRLAMAGMFQARWTQQIHEEWIRNVAQNNPHLKRERLETTAKKMDQAIMDSRIENYEQLIEGLKLPDNNDRHVLAAAIKGQADIIVTFNLKDFPNHSLEPFNIDAQHPDEFISHLIDLSPETVLLTVRQQRASLQKPAKTIDEFLETLLKQQLPRTATFLKKNKTLV